MTRNTRQARQRQSAPQQGSAVAVLARPLVRRAAARSGKPQAARPLPLMDETMLRRRVAELDARRKAVGCSQMALAAALGVSRSTVARLLRDPRVGRGLATVEGLGRLEAALGSYERTNAKAARSGRTAPERRQPRPPRQISARQDDTFAPRQRKRSTTVRIAKWAATDAPVDLTQIESAMMPAGGQRYRILIAEDDAATIGLYTMVLAEDDEMRYELDVVQTPQACLEHLRRARQGKPYDLLLTDLGLADVRPDDQRPSLLQQFAEHPDLLPPALLVVSGISPYSLQRKRAQLATLGAAFLAKPFDIDELLAVVRALCLAQVPPDVCVSFAQPDLQ